MSQCLFHPVLASKFVAVPLLARALKIDERLKISCRNLPTAFFLGSHCNAIGR